MSDTRLTKRKKAALITGISFIVLSVSLAIPSLAWFAKAQTSSRLDGLSGTAHGSYFNGGDGSKDKPFEINNPKQLYYFNWLQDLGYFNTPNDGKTAIDQVYFKLTSDLDMTGYTLPPAGTKQYPFVGNFDGASHSISNLVITNDESALKQADPPKGATYSDGTLSQAQIVGFFGVVGSLDGSDKVNSYTYDTKANAINNLGFDGLDVISSSSSTLMGLAAGYVNGLIKGVGVKDSSLQAKSSATPITDVAGVKNISDYSLVGYATEDYKSRTEVRDETLATPQIDNPNTNHGSTNWGGSVNMKQMYNDLESEERNDKISQDVHYVFSESVTVSPEGNESEPTDIVYSTNRFYQSGSDSDYYYRNGERTNADGDVIASYGLPYTNLENQKYVYILGSCKATNSSLYNTVTQTIQAYEKTISKNGVYLALDPSSSGNTRSLIASSDPSKALHWQVKDGKVTTTIKSTAATGGDVTSTLALTGNGSTPSLTSATGTNVWTWTFDEEKGNLSATSDGTAYYLDLENGSWILRPSISSGSSYLTIKDTSSNTYLAYSKDESAPVGSNSVSSGYAAWQYDSTNNCYRPEANSKLMLSVVGSAWTQEPILTATLTNSWFSSYARFTLSGANSDGTGTGYLKVDNFKGGTSYLVYSSNSFQVSYGDGWNSNLPGQIDNFEIAKVENTPVEAGLTFGSVKDSVYASETKKVRRPATATINPTYVPLAFSYSDANKTTISGVSDMNTGYLVGGANYDNKDDRAGDIRASKYYTLSRLYKSFGNSSGNTYNTEKLQILTHSSTKKIDGSYSDNGWTKIKDNYNSSSNVSISDKFTKSVDSSIFSRYDNARQNLQYTICGTYNNASMSGNTTLYGIHFMDAAISKEHLTTVGKATVYDRAAEAQYQENLKKYLAGELGEAPKQTGSVYKDYEVPEDSIDFNLATDGYVTFFGASYYVNDIYGANDSFFGLSEIIRDENQKITDIRSIRRIYANLGEDKAEKPYVYSYDGNKPANTDDNHMIFDVSWISTDVHKVMVNNCLYYFEIPINSGEYALGSVPGRNGAYLLYLDIGTGAADYQSVTIEEKTTSKIIKQSYPLGVDFIADVKEVSNIEGGQSAAIALLSTPVDKLKFTISSNGSATKITCSKAENLEIISQADAVTVSGPAGEALPSVSDSPLTITMNRKTIQTFSPANNRLSLAYSCTWTVDGASAGDEIQLYFPSSTGEWLVTGGQASIDKGTQVLTVNSGTSASIKAEGTGTKDATSDWMGPDSITVESVFSEFKIHVDNSTANVEYTYEELNKTYVIAIHCAVAFKVNVISLPADSEYKIQINGKAVASTGELSFPAQA